MAVVMVVMVAVMVAVRVVVVVKSARLIVLRQPLITCRGTLETKL